MHHLANLGADHIVHPELEGGLEMVYHTLLRLGCPLREVHQYSEAVCSDRYEYKFNTNEEHRSLHDLLDAVDNIEITWVELGEESPLVGQTLKEADIRSRTGASVVAVIREHSLVPNPKSSSDFVTGDRIGLIGEPEQVEVARKWLEVVQETRQPYRS